MNLRRLIVTVAVAASVAMGLVACAPTSEPIVISTDTVIVDVRTPEEFATGHLDGAINIDVQSPSFDSLASQLPEGAELIVYCRSGNRSGAAIMRLEALGFTAMTNAGGLDEAAASTGLAIVR